MSKLNNNCIVNNNCVVLNKTSNVKYRIICFTHSGSYASQYSLWEKYLPKEVECIIYERAGSGIRISEEPFTTWVDLINDVVKSIEEYLDLPYIIFGHSLGGSIAFEVAKTLEANAKMLPQLVTIGDREAPNHKPDKIRHNLSDEEFGEMLVEDYGMDRSLVLNKDIMEFFLPMLKNDFKLADTYFATFGHVNDKIATKIAVFRPSKTNDTIESHLDWAKYTNDTAEIIDMSGNHFFVFEHAEEFIKKLIRYFSKKHGG